MILISALACMALLLGPRLSYANDASPDSEFSFPDHTWFFYVGAGLARSSYDNRIQERIDEQVARGKNSPSSGVFDLPAIYRRIQPGLSAGLVLNATLEHFANSWRENDSFAIHTYNVAPSAQYFFSGQTGLGWFVRADLGYSRLIQIRQVPERYERVIDDGLFTQAAAGYGWRAGDVGALLMHISAIRAASASHHVNAASFNVGFLF